MKTLVKLFTPLIAIALLASPVFAQTTYLPNPGKYGVTGWAINNQRVASQYNYYIDSIWGSGLGAYSFPPSVIYQAVPKGAAGFAGGSVSGTALGGPFNTNATVNVIDVVSANTEVVAITSNSCGTGAGVSSVCTLSLSTANSHSSYILRSGTCGLREALNDLGGQGGEVIVDQRFYDDGCTASTITGITLLAAPPVLANQYIHDISNGQDTWYELKALNNTAISAAGIALVLTGSAGGSLTNSGTYYVNYEYVDPLGGQGLANTESAQITLSSQNTITTTAPAAKTGAVGWIPMITASAGASNSEIAVPVTSAVCTLSLLTPYPTCAIGSVAVITANPSATSKENVESFGHTAFGYRAINGNPSVSPTSTWGDFQTAFGPFVVGATLSSSNEDLAQMLVPGGYFNRLGGTWDVCVKIDVGTIVASGVLKVTLTGTNYYGQNPVVFATALFPTLTLGAAGTAAGCFEISTATVGSGGQFWANSPAWGLILNSTGTGVFTVENSAAISSSSNAPDLSLPIYLSVNAAETIGHNITSPIIDAMVIRPVPNN